MLTNQLTTGITFELNRYLFFYINISCILVVLNWQTYRNHTKTLVFFKKVGQLKSKVKFSSRCVWIMRKYIVCTAKIEQLRDFESKTTNSWNILIAFLLKVSAAEQLTLKTLYSSTCFSCVIEFKYYFYFIFFLGY